MISRDSIEIEIIITFLAVVTQYKSTLSSLRKLSSLMVKAVVELEEISVCFDINHIIKKTDNRGARDSAPPRWSGLGIFS